jgi:hypothetical protein
MMKMKLAITLLAMVLAMILIGGTLKGPEYDAGIKIEYKLTGDSPNKYQSDTDLITDYMVGSQTQSIQKKIESKMEIGCVENSDSAIGIAYTTTELNSSTFANGAFNPDTEEDELIGQTLTIYINPEDGKLKSWKGLEDLTSSSENGLDQAEDMANTYASIVFDYFPPRPLKVKDEWEVVNETKTSLENGGYVQQKITKSYRIKRFIEKDGFKCAEVLVDIKVDANTEIKDKDSDGNEFEIMQKGSGEGEGKLYFDFENGRIYYSKFAWIVDIEAEAKDLTTGEEESYKMYQESHRKFQLETE